MLQECDGKKLYAVVLLSNHVQSYPKWFDLIYIFEATFNSEYWDHSLLIAWDRIYLHRQIQNLSDVYNTWFYADVPVKDVVCVGCFFVSCCFFFGCLHVSSFFPCSFPLRFLLQWFYCGSCHQMSPLTPLTRQASVEWYPSTGASFCSSSKVVGRRRGGQVVDGTNSRWVNSLWRILGSVQGIYRLWSKNLMI